MSENLTLITGGTGAGKTAHALVLAETYNNKAYIATAEVIDDEMRAKVDVHIAERDETYTTIEEPINLAQAVAGAEADVIIIDCITFWINNLIYYKKDIEEYVSDLTGALQKVDKPVVMVTNEVGLGIISGDSETRRYAKALSKINKKLAEIADNVTMMVSGLPLKIK